MLIGTEEETGTMGWMRTIPARWQSVATSKLIVGLGSLLVVHVFANLVLWISSVWWPVFSANAATPFTYEAVVGLGLLKSVSFSVNLLLCGLVMTSLFRSPVGGILAVVPAIIFLTVFSLRAIEYVTNRGSLLAVDLSASQWMAIVSIMVVVWLLLIAGFCRLVKFRLTSTFVSALRPGILTRSSQAYRPPAAVTGLRRPSVTFALLWQQVRQTRTTIGAMLLISLACVWWSLSTANDNLIVLPLLFLCWIGAMTFYGDSLKGRCAFFAEKGISPTMVWWTRMLPTIMPAILLWLITLAVVSTWSNRATTLVFVAAIGAAGYGFGVFVSQWSLRPILAFFGGPAIMLLCTMPLQLWFMMYPNHFPLIASMSAILLFASWRLMRPWMDRRYDWSSKLRTVGYIALSVAVPILITIGHRVWTTPPAMTDWRARTMTMAGEPDQEPSIAWLVQAVPEVDQQERAFATVVDSDQGRSIKIGKRSVPKDQLLRVVVAEWKRYRQSDWQDSSSRLTSKTFAGTVIPSLPFGYEHTRTDRNIDRVAKVLIEQIESEQWFVDGESRDELLDAWGQARLGPKAMKSEGDWLLTWAFGLGQDRNP